MSGVHMSIYISPNGVETLSENFYKISESPPISATRALWLYFSLLHR